MTVNSRALQLLGIRDGDPDPIGGWYGRAGDGRLNGRVREGAEIKALRKLTAAVPLSEAAAAFSATGDEYARWGVTSFHQMAHNMPLRTTLQALATAKPTIKWSVYAWGLPERSVDEAWTEIAAAPTARGLVRVAGSKWMLDATPIERDAHMRPAYLGKPNSKGRPNYTPDQLRSVLSGALRHR